MLRIGLIEDHHLVRAGFRALIQSEPDFLLIHEASSAQSLTPEILRGMDILVLDLNMPKHDGFELLAQLKGQHSALFKLVVSMHDEEVYVRKAIQLGANGYISKNAAPEVLLLGLRTIALGHCFLSEDVARFHPSVDKSRGSGTADTSRGSGTANTSRGSGTANTSRGRVSAEARIASLTLREHQVKVLIEQGKIPKEIASRLNINVKTVYVHTKSLLEKLGFSSPNQLRCATSARV